MATSEEANARLIATLLHALRITRGNVASLGPAGSLLPMEYREWLAMIDAAIAAAAGIAELDRRCVNAELLSALQAILAALEEDEDIRDGSDGEQLPNAAMSYLIEHGDAMRAAIAKATGQPPAYRGGGHA